MQTLKKLHLLILTSIILISFINCAGRNKMTKESPQAKAKTDTVVSTLYGSASWYGKQFQGHKTASGEHFNMNDFTAAHRTLPFGTKVKVTFIQSQKSITVRINDRGPFVKSRVIDLSYKAANTIGLVPFGHGDVKLEVLADANTTELAQKDINSAGNDKLNPI